MTYPIYGIAESNAEVKETLIKAILKEPLVIKCIGENWAVVILNGVELDVVFDQIESSKIMRISDGGDS
jgi:hypothetical protein